jgi:hypothetical protein
MTRSFSWLVALHRILVDLGGTSGFFVLAHD